MSMKPARVQFNGGELSPWLEGRTDIAKYDKTAKLCRNFIPLAEGSLKRRGGTRFVAVTPEDDDIVFKVEAIPEEAEIFINGQKMAELAVSRGDEVTYLVRAEGYVTAEGKVTVTDDTLLTVRLVSLSETVTISVAPTPDDAAVKLNGYERRQISVPRNSVVAYLVYKNNYILQKGSVLADEDKTLHIVLEEDEQQMADYGDWGDLVGLVAVTSVGDKKHEKCFYIRFANGALPVIFSADLTAPEEPVDESLFYRTSYDMYNSVVTVHGPVQHTVAVENVNSIILFNYYDENHNTLAEIDAYTIEKMNWPRDENGEYTLFFDNYTGVATGNILKVYYKGDLVWELKGRKNG